MKTTIITYGAFDMSHLGHLNLLKRLKGLGDDWEEKFYFLKEHCEVVYLERTEDISTTQLKKSLSNFLFIPREDILNAFEVIKQLRRDFHKC